MPSPLGHALAGAAIAWSVEAIRRRPLKVDRFTLAGACIALAITPDLDFFYPPSHRMMTHSFVAVAGIALILWTVNRRQADTKLVTLACVAAYGSHLLLDWLGADTKLPQGVQLLWPFSREWFISDITVFRSTSIGGAFTPRVMLSNTLAVLHEVLILLPVAIVAFGVRRRRLRPIDNEYGHGRSLGRSRRAEL